MIPISDSNPTQGKVVLVPILIAINAIVFFFVQPSFGGDSEVEQLKFSICRAAIPFEATTLERLGDQDPASLDEDGRAFGAFQHQECPEKSILWSLVASMFLHGSLLHLAGNMLFLWVFGNNIEDRLGIWRFALFYLVAGLIATYAQALISPSSPIPVIGASGAIAGVLGAYLALFPHARVRTLVIFFFITVIELPAIVVLGGWFVLQVFQGAGPGAAGSNVAYAAHIGGFVAGLALLPLAKVGRPGPKRTVW